MPLREQELSHTALDDPSLFSLDDPSLFPNTQGPLIATADPPHWRKKYWNTQRQATSTTNAGTIIVADQIAPATLAPTNAGSARTSAM